LKATLETLKSEGFSGASARAIARTGKFNQALIYYHFGSVEGLLIAALADFSQRRLARYREALVDVSTLTELIQSMSDLYDEDRRGGEVTAVQEIVAGSSSSADMGPQVVELLDPWDALAEEIISRLLRGTPFADVIPSTDVAYALVALFFGVETLGHLDPERAKTAALFEAGRKLAPLFDMLLAAGKPAS
jgi:AcrR family transcriptional regulator